MTVRDRTVETESPKGSWKRTSREDRGTKPAPSVAAMAVCAMGVLRPAAEPTAVAKGLSCSACLSMKSAGKMESRATVTAAGLRRSWSHREPPLPARCRSRRSSGSATLSARITPNAGAHGMEAIDTLSAIHRGTVEQLHRPIEAGLFADGDRLEPIDKEMRDMTPIGPPHYSCASTLNMTLASNVAAEAIMSVRGPLIRKTARSSTRT